MFGTTPNYLRHLRIFGEIGIVKIPAQEGHKSKIANRGKEAIFVGYSNNHTGDVYRFYDVESKRIKISRDVRWTGKFYANSDYVSIPNYDQNAMIRATRGNRLNENTSETESTSDNQETTVDNTIRVTHDPTRDDMAEIVLVGGTDESYESPETFEKAWNHNNDYLREKWREAIKKEFENNLFQYKRKMSFKI